jgi:acyl-coenzyme A thioesterase PaaI-like protein
VTLELANKPERLQFSGSFHAGVLAGLADHCAGAAATTTFAPGQFGLEDDNSSAPKLTSLRQRLQHKEADIS